MISQRVGTYVTHAKLPDLGSGEIVSTDGHRFSIRFASGERSFVCALTEKHLTVTSEAPAPTKPSRAPSKSRAPKKAAAAKVVEKVAEE
jgi:hypothetical protein